MDIYGKMTYRRIQDCFSSNTAKHFLTERGSTQADTAVTENQWKLIDLALTATEKLDAPIVEVGSYRGVSTERLAKGTKRQVYAVDPFIGYGGSQSDFEVFQSKIQTLSNIKHIRATSGSAFHQLETQPLSFVFVDAVHDFANTWFDYSIWSTLLLPGGMIALHDVDDFPGSNLACRKALSELSKNGGTVWAYCPNLIIFSFSGRLA